MTAEKKVKKEKEDGIAKDLQDLYSRAKKGKTKVLCPHCNKSHDVEVGGDFMQLKSAMELRIKYAALTSRDDSDGSGHGDFFKEE